MESTTEEREMTASQIFHTARYNGATIDQAVAFVAEQTGLSNREAAQKINAEFTASRSYEA